VPQRKPQNPARPAGETNPHSIHPNHSLLSPLPLGEGKGEGGRRFFKGALRLCVVASLPFCLLTIGCLVDAAEPIPSHFNVLSYRVAGDPLPSTNGLAPIFSKYIGTTVSPAQIGDAASELQLEYGKQGRTNVSVSVALDRITNGVVTLNVFRTPVPQVLLSGRRYTNHVNRALLASQVSPAAAATNAPSTTTTNAGPHFTVRAYEIHGDTLLSTETLMSLLVPLTGTNVSMADIAKARSDLQMEYRNRGYPTVTVAIPPQKLTNGIVRIRVFEGRLSDIRVTGNRYFSSNNVMRSLPSLHTNTIISSPVFQAELDRANANQDRQIYPQIEPGPETNTTTLRLDVKDRLPLHAKVDFNNQNSPGTPDLRLNSSVVYNNLWQYDHSIGFQYGFSPTEYKTGSQWSFYDQPVVANYGGFYRLPLGGPESLEQRLATSPGTFGYSEATRKFNLPPPSGQAELNFFASRSTIDTGVMTLFEANIYNQAGNSLDRKDVQQDLTITSDVGTRLTIPLPQTDKFQSGFSAGVDLKGYQLTSAKTNIFTLTSIVIDTITMPPTTNINLSTLYSPVPTTERSLDYLPLSLRYNAGLRDNLGFTSFGLGLSVNAWHSGSASNVWNITGSTSSQQNWVILNPSLSRDFIFRTNWVLSLAASGQWTPEPLISNEQFGIGGVSNIRGYHEGEVFGNSGWWFTLEQKTPSALIGRVYGRSMLSVRGSVYAGYGQAFETQGLQDLWGAGFGGAASLGPNFAARFLFSWPLLSTIYTEKYHPRFDFGLSMQF